MIHIRIRPNFDSDVVVVGAGPAGAAFAVHMVRAGFKVMLIDRQTFPRDKVCGDFVGPAALLELKQLGITDLDAYKRTNKIRHATLYLDGKELITQSLPRVANLPVNARVITRMMLDHWILEAARKAGAQILEGHKVIGFEIDSDGVEISLQGAAGARTLRTKLLIGADGSSSTVARLMRGSGASNEDRIIAVRAYFEGIEGPADEADLYFTGKSFPGYYWLFPTGKKSANVGVGMVLETLPPADNHLRDLLSELIEKDSALKKRLKNARMVGKVVGWPLTTYNPGLKITDDRIMLIGDAAGLINPLNGEGIQYALLSGKWAAEAAANCCRTGDFGKKVLEPYAGRIEKEFRYDMALAGFLVQMIRNRILNPVWLQSLRIIVARARLDPDYAYIAGGILAGLLPASKVVNPEFILSTLEQAAMSMGVETALNVIRGPEYLANIGLRGLELGFDMAAETVQNPLGLFRWGFGVTNSAVELFGQVAKDFLSPS